MEQDLPLDLAPLLSHLEAAYPNEGCGLIFRARDGSLRTRPMKNVADKFHARFPEQYPRTAATAYLFDGAEQLAVERENSERGESLACIFHSHVDVGPYFSDEDKKQAAPDGIVLFPGVSYLVVAVHQGRAVAAKLHRLENERWIEREVPLSR